MGQDLLYAPTATARVGNPPPDAMARLLAVAGHDLKQPLHVAMMSIELALSEGKSGRARERLGTAQEALRRLGLELDDLARCSQSANALLPRREAVRLDTVFDGLDRDWRFYAERCGVELRLQRSSHVVESDPAMLMTILRNLVGNAVKYSKCGGRIVVGCRVRGGHLSVEVHDAGHGIPSNRLACIFEAFERGAWNGIGSGLGLGLFIVRQTAEALGHRVSVRSVEGVGSTFKLLLPRADCGRATGRPPRQRAQRRSISARPSDDARPMREARVVPARRAPTGGRLGAAGDHLDISFAELSNRGLSANRLRLGTYAAQMPAGP
jgi:signal transduction histidine kinase